MNRKNLYNGNIYNSDLKYKKYRRKLNKNTPENIKINNDDLLENGLDPTVDMDTLEYRFDECRKQGGKILVISHLGLKKFPEIPKSVIVIFGSNNKFKNVPNFENYNLQCIDLSNNKLIKTPIIADIEELNLSGNKLIDASSLNGKKIKRVDLSRNKLKTIPLINNIDDLEIRDNEIESIPIMDTLKILRVKNNKLTEIGDFKNLKIIDCINNNIVKIGILPLIEELYVHCNNISSLSHEYPRLRELSIYSNPINKIELKLNKLQNLIVDNKDFFIPSKMLSSIKHKYIYDKKIIELIIEWAFNILL